MIPVFDGRNDFRCCQANADQSPFLLPRPDV